MLIFEVGKVKLFKYLLIDAQFCQKPSSSKLATVNFATHCLFGNVGEANHIYKGQQHKFYFSKIIDF